MASKTLIYFPTVRMIGRCYNQLHLDNMTAQVCVYHGSLSKEEKQENYEKFRTGEKLVMLATKAFGMGVDISDIAIVAHFAPTGNVYDYGNDFTSEQRWDLLEDYFLGKIPEKVRKAVEREKTKKTKASEWEE